MCIGLTRYTEAADGGPKYGSVPKPMEPLLVFWDVSRRDTFTDRQTHTPTCIYLSIYLSIYVYLYIEEATDGGPKYGPVPKPSEPLLVFWDVPR